MSICLFAGALGFALGMTWGCRRWLDVDVTLYEAERAPIGFDGGGGGGSGGGAGWV